MTFPRIQTVKAFTNHQVKKDDQGADCHDVDDQHWINGYPIPVANPMSIYSKYQKTRKSWGINALGSLIVEVEAENGIMGIGVTIGGAPGAYIVEHHLSRFIEGQDPRKVELIWDQMFKATLNYGRKGLPIQAISAVDLAIWDLLGKLWKEPVYNLLGGKTKNRLPVYSTTARPDIAKELGFVGAKIPCPYGPVAGQKGFEENIKICKEWRAKVGDSFPLMLDCYMSLTVPYSIKLAKELEKLNFKWMEEFLPPDDYEGYREVKEALKSSSIMLTTGEHEYTRYGYRKLIEDKSVDVLQPDITWMGGITEARKVVAMASAYDILVIPHGSSIYSYHLQYAFTNCPVAEFINLSPKADQLVPYFGNLFKDEPLPDKGFVDLSEKPGFGVELRMDCDKNPNLIRPYLRNEQQSMANFKANAVIETDEAIMPF